MVPQWHGQIGEVQYQYCQSVVVYLVGFQADDCGAGAMDPIWAAAVVNWECYDGLFSHSHLRIHIRLDNIWMMFTKVVTCLSVLSSTNNLDDVGAMIGCMELTCRVSQLVMAGVNQMGYSCKLRALGIGVFLVIGIWLVGLWSSSLLIQLIHISRVCW